MKLVIQFEVFRVFFLILLNKTIDENAFACRP